MEEEFVEDESSAFDYGFLEENWLSSNQLADDEIENLMTLAECGICIDFLCNATETSCCHSIYCNDCITPWIAAKKTCPNCRGNQTAKDLVPNVPIQRFVQSLKVECPNFSSGCDVRPTRADLKDHQAHCEFRAEVVARKRAEALSKLQKEVMSIEKVLKSVSLENAKDIVAQAVGVISQLLEKHEGEKALNLLELVRKRVKDQKILVRTVPLLGDAWFQCGMFEKAMEEYEKLGGEVEPLLKISSCQLKLARYDDCEKTLRKALQSPGNKSASVSASILLKLGKLQKKMGAYGDATKSLEDGLKHIDNVRSNPQMYFDFKITLADVLRKTDRYDMSKKHYLQCLRLAEVEFGRRSIQVSTTLNALGMLFKKLAKYDECIKMYKAAIKTTIVLKGDSHASVGEFLNNLADAYRKKGEYSQAINLYERALNIVVQAVGPDHIEVADICNSMGLAQKKLANYDEAAALYDRAISIADNTFKGKDHYKMGNFLHNRADVLRKRAKFKEALAMYEKSIAIFDSTLGLAHSESADPLHAIGLVLHQEGKFKESLDYFDRALEIVRKEFSKDHYKCGMFLLNRGLAQAMLQEYEGAYKNMKEALRILRAALGGSHVEVGDCLHSLGDVCAKLLVENHHKNADKREEASEYYKKARVIFADAFGENHTKTQQMDSLIFITDNFSTLAQ